MVNKLEEIIEKGKKIAKTGLLGFALGFGNYLGVSEARAQTQGNDIEQGKVVVSLKCVDELGHEPFNRKITPNKKYQLQIIGDNGGVNAKTVEIDWFDVSIPNIAGLTDIPQPNPKYDGDFFRQENSDEKFVMHPFKNFVSVDDNYRSTKEINTSEGFIRKGPTNRIGILGIYNFIPLQKNFSRQINFNIRDAGASGGPGIIHSQPTKIKDLSVVVVNDTVNDVGLTIERDYASDNVKIEVLEANGKTSVLEYTTNLASGNWIPLATNKYPGQIFEITDSFDSARSSKFYRARVLQ
ncbi:MAG: hypothetical protein AABW75_01220 [Nanoarchaeota archaeon]